MHHDAFKMTEQEISMNNTREYQPQPSIYKSLFPLISGLLKKQHPGSKQHHENESVLAVPGSCWLPGRGSHAVTDVCTAFVVSLYRKPLTPHITRPYECVVLT